jgi:hypothetical protein
MQRNYCTVIGFLLGVTLTKESSHRIGSNGFRHGLLPMILTWADREWMLMTCFPPEGCNVTQCTIDKAVSGTASLERKDPRE